MAVAFTRFSCWIWGGKDHKSPNSSLSSSPDFPAGFRELDNLKFPPVDGPRVRSNSRKIKKKWQSREERRIDKEYDIVLVPSDGVCMSGSETEDSDWSIGWLEPHAPDFQSNSEVENSFSVLVRCYCRGRCEQAESSKTRALGALEHLDDISPGKLAKIILSLKFVFFIRYMCLKLSVSSLLVPTPIFVESSLSLNFTMMFHYLIHDVKSAKTASSCFSEIAEKKQHKSQEHLLSFHV
ncbi:hypothetical protein ZIOFF_024389 [Zingiber officinale]|uniref:Uncharacterized protein n=1 Tax=Zingiber officinale TaxID=94328 RepID=A0A8J5L676_ZINOF|nr:hypothetical protein ZIOFF_024389 [Zingiber officinale]